MVRLMRAVVAVLLIVPLVGCAANATVHVKGRRVAGLNAELLTPPQDTPTENLVEARGTITVVRPAPPDGAGG